MKLKVGASLEGTSWRMWEAALVAEAVYKEFGFSEITVTEGSGGKHKDGSLHYKGLAIDIRTWHIASESLQVIAGEIRHRLGPDYDVVVEADHIHLEYDPKGPV